MAVSLSMIGFATPLTAQQAGGQDTGQTETRGAATFGASWSPARTAQFDMIPDGGSEDAAFRILVSVPDAPPPSDGYGIIYALDAGWTFGTLRDAVRMQASRFASSAVKPTVIVAIGWPTPDLIDFDRRGADLIGVAGDVTRRDATLRFIEHQLLPRIEGALPVDPGHRMILGHSFGGAFALQVRAHRPGLFSHVAAGSPSIWTDPEGLFAAATPAGAPVLITIGELETPEMAEASGQPADRVARLRARDMHGRARRMAAALDAQFVEFAGETHGSSVTVFLSRAVGFLWSGI